MIFVYQLFHDNFTINSSVFFTPTTASNTRGHNHKLFKSHTHCLARSEFFNNRVIEDWNHLPHYIVNANSLNSFKYLLDDYWTENFYELL